jgi:hypothetical protein
MGETPMPPQIMSHKTNLSLNTFVLNAGNLKEQLQEITIQATNKDADAAGIADRYEYPQIVKQDQEVNITAHWFNDNTNQEAVSLDISVWEPFGGDLLAELKSGTFKVTTKTVEESGAAMAYTITTPNGTSAMITTSHMISTNAALLEVAMTGTLADFEATALITFAGETIQVPVLLSAASHKIVRGELQMEDVTLKMKGTPTAPTSDGTLLYLALAGSATTSISTDTGANTYSATGGPVMTICEYSLRFDDASLIKETIQLKAQGALAVA